jgi:hypothetical protein
VCQLSSEIRSRNCAAQYKSRAVLAGTPFGTWQLPRAAKSQSSPPLSAFLARFLLEDSVSSGGVSRSRALSHKSVSTSSPAEVDASLSMSRSAVARNNLPTDSTRSA